MMATGNDLRFLLDIVHSLAQRGNMDAKIGLLDERVRPDMPDDFRIGLQASRMRGEENEDIGRPAAQHHGPAIAQKRAAGRRECERSELQVAHKVILIQAPLLDRLSRFASAFLWPRPIEEYYEFRHQYCLNSRSVARSRHQHAGSWHSDHSRGACGASYRSKF